MCSLQEHIERDIRARKSAADELAALGQEFMDGYASVIEESNAESR
jgi:hypothetical protein